MQHFANTTYLENKVTQAETDLQRLSYSSDKTCFKLEDYYNRMMGCFNDLAIGGTQYALNEHQKIARFGQGLNNAQAVKYFVDIKTAWMASTNTNKNFDDFYNLFSSQLQQYHTLMDDVTQSHTRCINQLTTTGRSKGRGEQFRRGREHG